MPLPNLPVFLVDKANHYLYGSVLFLILGSLARLAEVPYHLAVAGAAVGAIAVGKEAMDRLSNLAAAKRGELPTHGVEALDVVWTLAGAAVVALGSFL